MIKIISSGRDRLTATLSLLPPPRHLRRLKRSRAVMDAVTIAISTDAIPPELIIRTVISAAHLITILTGTIAIISIIVSSSSNITTITITIGLTRTLAESLLSLLLLLHRCHSSKKTLWTVGTLVVPEMHPFLIGIRDAVLRSIARLNAASLDAMMITVLVTADLRHLRIPLTLIGRRHRRPHT